MTVNVEIALKVSKGNYSQLFTNFSLFFFSTKPERLLGSELQSVLGGTNATSPVPGGVR